MTSHQYEIIPGLNAGVQYYFAPTRPLVRAIYKFENTGKHAITADVTILGDLGSDTSTTVRQTGSGDGILDDAEQWFVTNDGGASVAVTTTRYGTGAEVIPTNTIVPGTTLPVTLVGPAKLASNNEDKYGMNYQVTIPAGQTRYLMVFHELSADPATSATRAADFASLTSATAAGLLTDVPAEVQALTVNYTTVPATRSTDSGGGGAMSVPVLLAGVGLAMLRRRRSSTLQ